MNNSYLDKIDLEHIKRAINIEEKYKYINLQGLKADFSNFMLKQLNKIYKESGKNVKWLNVIEAFEHYSTENAFERKKIINRFITVLKSELRISTSENIEKQGLDVFNDSVITLKGVGPKFGYLLNKVGIFSVNDLISYYPKKYIDYSARCLIKHLKVGQTVTIYGQITAVKTYTTKNSLTIIKVTVSDESGSLDLNFFYSKINRYSIERYKSQFPKYSGIIISGVVKTDNYSGTLTIDKPQYQLVSEASTD
ncbi:hypothetical protein II906_09180, partial [bacterium]|nr:hypothetical protein [bacterium]